MENSESIMPVVVHMPLDTEAATGSRKDRVIIFQLTEYMAPMPEAVSA
jgi:hypothetical protein